MKNWRDKFPFDLGLILGVLGAFSVVTFFICTITETLDIFHYSTKEAKVLKALWPFSFFLGLFIMQLQILIALRKIYRDILPEKNLPIAKYKLSFNFGVVAILPLALVSYFLLNSYLEKRKYISKVENAVSLYASELEKLDAYLSSELYSEKYASLQKGLEKEAGVEKGILVIEVKEETQTEIYKRSISRYASRDSEKCEKEECDYFSKTFNNSSQEILYRKLEKEHWIYVPIKVETKTKILLFQFSIEEKK